MTAHPTPIIVVGYDGSPPAKAALRLAARRVGGGTVFVVHGYDAPADYWGVQHAQTVLHAALDRGERLLAEATDAVPELAAVHHVTELIGDHPVNAIASVATVRGADEIILGTRGFGRFRGALGSVAHALLHEAQCPVTVIPAGSQAARAEAGETAREVAA
jgi:nucleotide-binding universal stress UspA family protein